MSPQRRWITNLLEKDHYRISEHVVRSIMEAKATLSQIIDVLLTGKIIETHDHPKRARCHIVLAYCGAKPVHVMIAGAGTSLLDILIVYEPQPSMWQSPENRSIQKEGAMDHQQHQCFFCTGKVEPIIIGNFDYRLEGKLYVVKSVPAGLCKQCGEKYISPQVARIIEAMINSEQFVGQDSVKVFQYPA